MSLVTAVVRRVLLQCWQYPYGSCRQCPHKISSLAGRATGSVASVWYCVSVSNSWQQVVPLLIIQLLSVSVTTHTMDNHCFREESKHRDSYAINTSCAAFILTGANPVQHIWATARERWEIGIKKQRSSGRGKKREKNPGENVFFFPLCTALSISEKHLLIVIK